MNVEHKYKGWAIAMGFSDTIRKLRNKAGLSQQDVADGVGIARATYIKMENGDREPKLDEIRALCEYYQIDTSSLIDDQVSAVEEPPVTYERKTELEEIVPREINPLVKPEKLRQVILYVLGKVGAKPNVGETVLYKLLYFIDFDYYEKTGKSITGLTYIHNKFGPSPVVDFRVIVDDMCLHDELEIVQTNFYKNTQKKYLPHVNAKLETLAADEIKHIDATLERLADKTATELSKLSHYDTPWVVAKQGQPLDYRDTFYRTNLTAVTEPDDEL